MERKGTVVNILKFVGKVAGVIIIIFLAQPWKDKTERFNEIVLKGSGSGIVLEKYLDKTSHLDSQRPPNASWQGDRPRQSCRNGIFS